MSWLKLLMLTISLLLGHVASLSLDPVASAELEQFIKKGDLVISMRHIRPRRKMHILTEALFMIDFPTIKHKMSFFLDRKKQRVSLDISDNGLIENQNFDMPSINETTTIRSLAFYFHNNGITLLVDCNTTFTQEIANHFSKLHFRMDDPVIKLFRERKYPLHFDGNVNAALRRVNCEKAASGRGHTKMLKNADRASEKNKKRYVRNWYSQNTVNNLPQKAVPMVEDHRGDIPIMHGDCEDAIAKSLNDLIALIKLLREDISYQQQEIVSLRNFIENCAGCKKVEENNQIQLVSACRAINPCHFGVECRDTIDGPKCGNCPNGLVGNGIVCESVMTCAQSPCYVGVPCHDTYTGFKCDSCPLGYEGDGRTCELRDPCGKKPCPSGSILVPPQNVQHYQRQFTARKYSVTTP